MPTTLACLLACLPAQHNKPPRPKLSSVESTNHGTPGTVKQRVADFSGAWNGATLWLDGIEVSGGSISFTLQPWSAAVFAP
jgi:hypothetical protein